MHQSGLGLLAWITTQNSSTCYSSHTCNQAATIVVSTAIVAFSSITLPRHFAVRKIIITKLKQDTL